MIKFEHSPAPWDFDEQDLYDCGDMEESEHVPSQIYANDGFCIVSTEGGLIPDLDSNYTIKKLYANARLIVSAPSMIIVLEMLKQGVARIETNGSLSEFCFNGMRYIIGDWCG